MFVGVHEGKWPPWRGDFSVEYVGAWNSKCMLSMYPPLEGITGITGGLEEERNNCRCCLASRKTAFNLMTYTIGHLLNCVEGICEVMELLKFCGEGWALYVTGTRYPITRHKETGITREGWGKDTHNTCILFLNLLASNQLKHEWKTFFSFPRDEMGL